MSVATFGFYKLYWFYKNWQFIKQDSGEDIMPFWRAFFNLFWVYSCFTYIGKSSDKYSSAAQVDTTKSIAVAYILFTVMSFTSAKMFVNGEIFSIIIGFLQLHLIYLVNEIALKINKKQIPSFQNNTRFSLGNYIWLGIIWLLIIVGLSVNEDFERANELYENGQYEEAIQSYDKAIKAEPNLSEGYTNKCLALSKIGNYEEALKACDKGIELDPKSNVAYNNKGLVLFQMGKYEDAIDAFDKSIKLDSKDAVSYFNKASALAEIEKYEEAIKAYNKAIELAPKSSEYYSDKAFALYNLQKYEEALYAYDKAIELDNTNSVLYQSKARILEYLERENEAREAYEMAAKIEASKELMQSSPEDQGRALRELYEIQSNQ